MRREEREETILCDVADEWDEPKALEDDIGAGGKKLLFILLAAAESHVVVSVFVGARIPIGAHARERFGIVHLGIILASGVLSY